MKSSAKQNTSLEDYSQAISRLGREKEEERREHERKLGKPLLFIKDVETKGHGVGYFRTDKETITAFRRYSDGYSIHPVARYDRKTIKQLWELFQA